MTDALALALAVGAAVAPGLVVGLLAGLRGWLAAAAAPLLSYGVLTAAAAACVALHLQWTPRSAAAGVAAAAVIAALISFGWRRTRYSLCDTRNDQPLWTGPATAGVAATTGLAVLLSGGVLTLATGWLSAIPQDWDAIFHANVVRFIADTGTPDPATLAAIHYYDDPAGFYYPNGLHLVAALVYRLSNAPIATTLDATAVIVGPIFTLSLVGLLRQLRVRPLLAGCAAALSAAVPVMPYDLLGRGPVLPNALGLALVPAFLALLHAALADRSFPAMVLLPVGAAALLTIHPSNAFVAAAFGLLLLAGRWTSDWRRAGRDLAPLAGAAVGCAVLAWPAVRGAMSNAAKDAPFRWPADLSIGRALLDVAGYDPGGAARLWLAALAAVGVLSLARLRRTWWLLVGSGAFASLYVLVATLPADWVAMLTRPWWNDRWRLIAVAAPGLVVLAAQGAATGVDGVRWLVGRLTLANPARRVVTAAIAAAALTAVMVGTGALYAGANRSRVDPYYQAGPVVTPLEVDAYRRLGELAEPGDRVMNQGTDGSPWMYAIAGVHPVNGHADQTKLDDDRRLLLVRFNAIDINPDVRHLTDTMNIRWVIVGRGYVSGGWEREWGLRGLDRVPSLQLVYENPDARIYRVLPAAARNDGR